MSLRLPATLNPGGWLRRRGRLGSSQCDGSQDRHHSLPAGSQNLVRLFRGGTFTQDVADSLLSRNGILRRGQIAIQSLNNPIQMFLLIGMLFIIINFSLSKAAEALERRLSTSRRKTADSPAPLPSELSIK